jgi:methylated-DNA-protein-cysteine methyltransferase-like protein
MGEYSIDFSVYGWFPDFLPSEEAEFIDDDSEEADEA